MSPACTRASYCWLQQHCCTCAPSPLNFFSTTENICFAVLSQVLQSCLSHSSWLPSRLLQPASCSSFEGSEAPSHILSGAPEADTVLYSARGLTCLLHNQTPSDISAIDKLTHKTPWHSITGHKGAS